MTERKALNVYQAVQAAEALHTKALKVSENYKRNELELINILQEFDQTKGFLHLKFKSLHEYAVKALRLSSEVAYILISVARKSQTIPELKAAIESQELTANEVRKILPVVTQLNKTEWITKAKEMPQKALEKEVARANPKAATPEKARYVTESRLNLNLGVSEDLYKKLKRIQDLESTRSKRALSFEEIFEVMTDLYLSKNDPVQRAIKFASRIINNLPKSPLADEAPIFDETPVAADENSNAVSVFESSLVAGQVLKALVSDSKGANTAKLELPYCRTPLPAALRHQVVLRDQGQCTESKCGSSRWIDIHHVIPISAGGTNQLENLKTLCWAHHKMRHLRTGLQKFPKR